MVDQPPRSDVAVSDPAVFAVIAPPSAADDRWCAFIAFSGETDAPPHPGAARALEGVTFAVKNNILASGLAARAASPAIDAPLASRDAEIVRRLKAHGAVCVGTLNMHELALGTTSANAFFGSVTNPRDATRVAGGSSGGSAAAVAGGLVSFSLSTDTGGSSRIPAAYCGVVGLRPSTGRYPLDGLLALSPSRDTAGVMASTVAQVALVDSVITDDFAAVRLAVGELRLGIPRNGFFEALAPEVQATVELALKRLADSGVTLVETEVDGSHNSHRAALAVVAYEAPRAILATRGIASSGGELSMAELADLADFIDEVASPDVRQVLGAFTQNPVSQRDYLQALAQREQLRAAYDRAFATADVHALVYPTVPVTAPRLGEQFVAVDGEQRAHFPTSIRNTDPGSFAGMPAVTVPIPRPAGVLPVGLGIEAPFGQDRHLLAIAAVLERVLEDVLTSPFDRI